MSFHCFLLIGRNMFNYLKPKKTTICGESKHIREHKTGNKIYILGLIF